MTTTTFFSASTLASGVTGKRSAPASTLVSKAVAGAQAAFKTPRSLVSATTVYPWMTQAMLGRMSPRARRLLRAAY
ncbi:hypothetical protein [Polaromonas eurypsychrophila]|uniref:Uncharacterized protein n=1 Tax=Polaromonas eurypsychrophila TaxID=1614635 RepID=A0A916WN14_9BURK|nr:hypothetical protein [Polaromonas eurypsychrophila]GGB13802.1 hypothetical protein GCM10011496_38460 [Polaromonas eurypsychrophila]